MVYERTKRMDVNVIVCQSLLFLTLNTLVFADEVSYYTNEFAVGINGDADIANDIAREYSFTIRRHLKDLGGVYQFVHDGVSRRSKRSSDDLTSRLYADPRVIWVEQQTALKRSKRSVNYAGAAQFNDPFFDKQWYLVNRGQTGGAWGHDMNIVPVWKKGFTGKGVVVTIIDDGLDHTHPDLRDNYDPKASANFNGPPNSTDDPMPNTEDPYNSHGTKCAGEVAARANNLNCGVGVAFNAKIGGIRMLDGVVTDITESESLLHSNQHVDIYSSSWGPEDNGRTLDGPRRLAWQALEKGAKKGRGGKGSIFVWATGNGGAYSDDCNCDGYITSIYTLAVGSITEGGLSTYFSEICPSTMAVVFTGGSHLPPGHPGYENSTTKVVTTDLNGKCSLDFIGTSTAAPLLAGCLALVLEANPHLTWRDVQNIVAETSVVPNEDEDGWKENGAGYHVNHRFGFGAIDCSRMVEAAQAWKPVQEQRECFVESEMRPKLLMSGGSLSEVRYSDGCKSGSSGVDTLEHVQVRVMMAHVRRGNVSIDLRSPNGTLSHLLKLRPLDTSSKGINFTFKTVHSWGESPIGLWTLTVKDNGDPADEGRVGMLVGWKLLLYGVKGEHANHERWRRTDGYLSKDGRIRSTALRRRKLEMRFTESVSSAVPDDEAGEDRKHSADEDDENFGDDVDRAALKVLELLGKFEKGGNARARLRNSRHGH